MSPARMPSSPTLAGSYGIRGERLSGATAAAPACVVSLRPRGQHGALRRAAARHGARVLALSPLRIELRGDAATRAGLRTALEAPLVVFTSPNAVHAARALQPLRARRGQTWLAVGEGTAAALRRAGIAHPVAPARMDSTGLLALPQLQVVDGIRIGLVTAPGGRDRIGPALRARGAQILRAEVYARIAVALRRDAVDRLCALRTPPWLALSSGEALDLLLAALPADALRHLRRARVVAASPRLAALASRHGFDEVVVAASAQPRDLLAAAARAGSR